MGVGVVATGEGVALVGGGDGAVGATVDVYEMVVGLADLFRSESVFIGRTSRLSVISGPPSEE